MFSSLSVSLSPTAGNTSSAILPSSHRTSWIPTGAIAGIATSIVLLLLITAGSIIIRRARARKYLHPEHENRIRCRTSEHAMPDAHHHYKASDRAVQPEEPVPVSQPARASIEATYTPTARDLEQQVGTRISPLPAQHLHRDPDEPEIMRPYIIDAASLPELVERVAHAILSHPRLGRVSTGEEPPPQYTQ